MNNSLKIPSISCFTWSRIDEPVTQANLLAKKSFLNDRNISDSPLDKRSKKHMSWVRSWRVSSDPVVNQKVGRVNPGLHWPHSAAPHHCSAKHEYEKDSPLTCRQSSAPGLTPEVMRDLTWQLYCGKETERWGVGGFPFYEQLRMHMQYLHRKRVFTMS